jgi:hypothetical protein
MERVYLEEAEVAGKTVLKWILKTEDRGAE